MKSRAYLSGGSISSTGSVYNITDEQPVRGVTKVCDCQIYRHFLEIMDSLGQHEVKVHTTYRLVNRFILVASYLLRSCAQFRLNFDLIFLNPKQRDSLA